MSFFIADTSAIIAAYDRAAEVHDRARGYLATSVAVVSPFVLDEIDHLLIARFGKDSRTADLVLDDLLTSAEEGGVLVPAVDRDGLRVAQKIIEQYRGRRLDLADAVNVVLAERYLANDILTLDEKDFRAPLTPAHSSFRLLLQGD
ncbi:PIN domain-containing protein [Nocardia sp. NPDC101769]|uniref:PIN domain-containing protein n=1 Tax=Nocardia sp. NPDC101769 TaxID=3364333 RepID=UPI0038115F8B